FLQRVEFSVAREAFDGRDFLRADGAARREARTHGHAVDEHGARAALAFAAAVFGAGEREVVAQHAEERTRRIGIARARGAVDVEGGDVGHGAGRADARLEFAEDFLNAFPSLVVGLL